MATEDAAQIRAAQWGDTPLHGQQLDHYTLIRQFGHGGYASIYLGIHHYLNTYVALKLLNHILASVEDVKRFQFSAVNKKQFKKYELHGSANYIAPEQINDNPRLSSDQYALAAVVYQWLCGQPLFQGTGLQVCLHHLSTPPPRLRDRVRSIAQTVERVVLRALSKDPYQRYVHVQEFAHALKQASRC